MNFIKSAHGDCRALNILSIFVHIRILYQRLLPAQQLSRVLELILSCVCAISIHASSTCHENALPIRTPALPRNQVAGVGLV